MYLALWDCWHPYLSCCCQYWILRQRTCHWIGALECCWVNEGSKNGLTRTYLIRRSTPQCWIIAQPRIVQADSSCTHHSSPTDSTSTGEPRSFFLTSRRHVEIFFDAVALLFFPIDYYIMISMAHDVPGMLFATTQTQTAHARYRQQSLYFCTVLQNGSDPVLTGGKGFQWVQVLVNSNVPRVNYNHH